MLCSKSSIKQLFNRLNRWSSTKIDYNKDYYGILGVKKSSSDSEIKKQYYKMAKMYHPDINSAAEDKFKLINEAYEVLGTQKSKKLYDNNLAHPSSQSTYGSGYHQNKYTYNYSNYSNYSRTKYQNQQRQKVYQDQYQYNSHHSGGEGYNQFYDEYINRKRQQEEEQQSPEQQAQHLNRMLVYLAFIMIFQFTLCISSYIHTYWNDKPQLEYTVYDQENDLLYLVDYNTYQRVIKEGNFKAIQERQIKEIEKKHQEQQVRLKEFQATYDKL